MRPGGWNGSAPGWPRWLSQPGRDRDRYAESARLLFALNDAAKADAPRLARQITAGLDALLDGDLRSAAPGEIEQRGRERLVALSVAAADDWRQRQREHIEQGLAGAPGWRRN